MTSWGRVALLLAVGAAVGRCAFAQALSRDSIEAVIRKRAEAYLGQRYLVVDYYRIHRKLVYPLPVSGLSIPDVPAPSIDRYPWATWMVWELEERVYSLGWMAEWFGDAAAREAVARDLDALASWPTYAQYGGPDLSSAHAGRMLWVAATKWHWLDDGLRERIKAACARHADEIVPGSDKAHGAYTSKADILALPEPAKVVHNIPFIGTIGAALTARVAGHPAQAVFDQRVSAIFGAILDLHATGLTEGVGYDGYVLDFIADWLDGAPADAREAILGHPALADFLNESYRLGAPGKAERVADLSDVEPVEMPFHLGAQAKLAPMQSDPVRGWLLRRCAADWLRCDALAAVRDVADGLEGAAPDAGALDARYALVLRSGWEAGDLAVVMSCTDSPMSHLQCDNGTIVIGTAGEWIIADPGYQQYLQGLERDFTLGPTAHNYPVINGLAQTVKAPRRIALEEAGEHCWRACVNLTGCYPEKAGVTSVVRNLWLVGRDMVVVADSISAAAATALAYYWHGHRDAAWGFEDGWACVHLDGVDVRFTSPQVAFTGADLARLEGTRGQLTLVANADPGLSCVWWVFAVDRDGSVQVAAKPSEDGKELDINGRRFSVREELSQ